MNLKFIYNLIKKNTEEASHQIVPFGILGFLTFPLFYLLWHILEPSTYDSFILRFIACALCFPLIFKNKWPKTFKKILPYYWHITLTYCLPFFFSFMTLANDFSNDWIMTSLGGLILFILVTDWLPLIIMLIMGVLTAFTIIKIQFPSLSPSGIPYELLILNFSPIIIFYVIFKHKINTLHKQRLLNMKHLGAAIAHELRTPLLGIKVGVSIFEKYTPKLIQAYENAERNGIDIPEISNQNLSGLESVLERMNNQVKLSNTIINMTLMNMKTGEIPREKLSIFSIKSCLDKIIETYPFNSKEKSLPITLSGDDFNIKRC